MIERVDPRTAPVLYCLAVGGAGNEKAEAVYAKMMEYTQQKGKFTGIKWSLRRLAYSDKGFSK